MSTRFCTLLFLLILMCAFNRVSQCMELQGLKLDTGVALAKHLELLPNSQGMTASQLSLAQYQQKWLPYNSNSHRLNDSQRPLWLRLSLTNNGKKAQQLLLNSRYSAISKIELYVLQRQRIVDRQVTGMDVAYHQRPVQHRYPGFILSLNPQQQYTVYLRYYSSGRNAIDRSYLWSSSAYFQRVDSEAYVQWFFIGAITALGIVSLLIFLRMGERQHLYYTLFILSSGYILFFTRGFAAELLFTEQVLAWSQLTLVWIFASHYFTVLFASHFLGLKRHLPRLYYLLRGFMFAFVVAALINLMPEQYLITKLSLFVLLLVPIYLVLFWLVAIWQYKQGQANGSTFLIAWTPYFVVSLIVYSQVLLPVELFIELSWAQQFNHLLVAGILFYGQLTNLFHSRVKAKTALAESMAKTQFIAQISHEIRTPMHGIAGMSEMLDQSPLNQQQKDHNKIIQRSISSLISTVSDIMDYANAEAGQLELKPRYIELSSIIEDSLNLFTVPCRNQGLKLSAQISPHLPRYCWLDPLRLQQVLNNLLGNAFKYTEAGSIHLSVHLQSGSSQVEIKITDTGCGISPQRQKFLFNAFQQDAFQQTKKTGGLGLGLTLCRFVLRQMNGDIGVTSKQGEGSCFWLRFDITQQESASPPKTVNALSSINLLYCDAAQDYQLDFVGVASHYEMQLFYASNQQICGQQLKAHQIDVLVLEESICTTPGSFIQSLNQQYPDLAVVYLLAPGRSCDDSLYQLCQVKTKPYSAYQLCAMLNDMVAIAVGPELGESNKLALTVLVAEDNAVCQTIVQSLLNKLRCPFTLASDGEQVFHHFKESLADDTLKYDLVLMDCEMPRFDGFQAASRVRQYEQAKALGRIPIIAMTAHSGSNQLEKLKTAGMDDHLVKPFNKFDLEAMLRKWSG